MSGTHGVFQHRSGYFYTILEEDFCEVYKKDGVNEVCRAYITSILEHLTNKQFDATGSDEDIWVFMSLPEMERRMRKACSQRTIHKEIQGMIKDGYLSKRRAVGKATMEYKLNLKKIRNALEALPEPQSCNSATYHLANLQDQSSNSARITLQNDKNDLAELQPRIHIDIPIEETKKEEGDAPASFDLKETVRQKLSDPQMRAITEEMLAAEQATYVTDTVSHSYRQNTLGSAEDEDDTPTEKVPVVKPSRQPVGAILTEEQLDEAYDAYIAPSKQPASGLRITQAPTSKAATQERMPEPAPPTDKQLKQQQTRRETEIWARIEAKLETTFSRTQRKSPKNKRGMEHMIEDQISDEMIDLGLDRLSEWEINNFNVEMFHELLPGKTAKHRSSQNGKPTNSTVGKKSTDVNDYSITALLKRQAAAQG